MLSKSEGSNYWRYGWDYENRLTEASTRKRTVRYRYDALGRRVQRYFSRGGKDNTKFTYDGQDVVQDNNDGVITKYQNGLGIDNKLKLTTNGTSRYFLQDHLGSTTGLTNSSGSLVESASYDAFGNASSNLSTRYSYTGREYDSFAGLYYYRARFYDAKLGRFISEDPIGFAGKDINLYGYVWNNPIKFVDPQGLDGGASIALGGGALIGGGATTGGGLVALAPPAAVAAAGALAIYGAWQLGEYIASRNYPEQYPETQTLPRAKPDASCDTKPKVEPKPSPNLSATPRPFPPPNEPKRECNFMGSFINAATGKKHCNYRCRGGGFPGSYIIVAPVEATEECPSPDKNDNDWIPGGF
jgi:RHS repeat-associated protein